MSRAGVKVLSLINLCGENRQVGSVIAATYSWLGIVFYD